MTSWDDPALSNTGEELGPRGGEGLLGQGGQAAVVRALDRELPREVALKVAELGRPDAQARLEQEAALLARLEHPGIVPVYGLFRAESGDLTLALRIVRGETLQRLAKANVPSERPRLLRAILQAAEALAYAHHEGIVHRDVTPANIMIGEFGETQVIDWGLAIELSVAERALGEVVGTPAYMAPEQARGERPNPAMDVFGLGVCLYEVASGMRLWAELGAAAIVASLARGELPPRMSELPRELEAIVTRALSASPDERYPDARAFARDLAAWLDGRPVSAHRYSRREQLARFVLRWRLPHSIAAAVLTTGIGLGLVSYLEIRDERDRARDALSERDAQLVRIGTIEAGRALAEDRRADGERAAADVLALVESPLARGVVAAFAREEIWRAKASLEVGHCVEVEVAPGGVVYCGWRAGLALWRPTGGWSAPLPMAHIGAAFVGGGAALVIEVSPERSVSLEVSSGRMTDLGPLCGGTLRSGAGARFGVAQRHRCLALTDGREVQRLDPCEGAIHAVGVGPNGEFSALCEGGALVSGRTAEPARNVMATGLVEPAGYFVSAAWREDAVFFGTTRGELVRVAHGRPPVRAQVTAGAGGPAIGKLVRSLSNSPDGTTLAAHVDAAGTLLLSVRELRVRGRAAGGLDLRWSFVGAEAVTIGGGRVTWWERTGDAGVHAFDAGGPITALAVEGPWLAVARGTGAALFEVDSGRALATFDGAGPTAKAVLIAQDQVVVGMAAAESRTESSPFVAIGDTRRIAALGERQIRTTTRAGLPLEPGGWLSRARVFDMGTLGDRVVALETSPREIVLLEVGEAPVELARCAAPQAEAVALLDPLTLLGAERDGVFATRSEDCVRVGHYLAPGEVMTRVAAGGGWVAGGSRRGEVWIWRADGTLTARLPAHAEPVTALAFDTLGHRLVSGSWDGRVRLLDARVLEWERGDLVDVLRQRWSGTEAW